MAMPVQVQDLRPASCQPAAITLLRLAALECRAAARFDVGRAEVVLGPGEDGGTIATLIARALPQALRCRPILRAPGAEGQSFDEAWLLAVLAAMRRGDGASERFLLARRCLPRRAAGLAMLLRAYAHRLAG